MNMERQLLAISGAESVEEALDIFKREREANLALAAESERLREGLANLVAASDGIDNMDEADGSEFWFAQNAFDNALEAARLLISGAPK